MSVPRCSPGPMVLSTCSTPSESESASILAMSESTLPAMLLAATHPQRVRSLVLWSPFANYLRAPDQPFGMPESAVAEYVQWCEDEVGTGKSMMLAPSWEGDAGEAAVAGRGERLAGGPGYLSAILDLFLRTDVRPALESIQAPTLVLHRRGDRHVPDGHAQYVAERIPQARWVEFDGDDHEWFAGDTDRVLDEIESFLTGARRAPPTNRVLSTVLFTDIVGSTERAAALGRSGLDGGAGRAQPRRRTPCDRRTRDRSSSSPATARSRHSTGQRERSTAPARFATPCKTSGFPSGPACTPARSRWWTATCTASRYTSRRGSWRSPDPTRYSYRGRSRRWCWDPESRSTAAATTS